MVKEIIYTLVSKEKTQVLCEFTDFRGNFETIAQGILNKVKENSRATILFEKDHLFYYLNREGITAMCLCDDEFPKDSAFYFLEEIISALLEKFTKNEIQKEKAYSKVFSDIFSPIIREKMQKYNSNPDASDSIKMLKKGVLEYRDNVFKANELLLERDQKLNLVAKKADSLKLESGVYYNSVSILNILIFKLG